MARGHTAGQAGWGLGAAVGAAAGAAAGTAADPGHGGGPDMNYPPPPPPPEVELEPSAAEARQYYYVQYVRSTLLAFCTLRHHLRRKNVSQPGCGPGDWPRVSSGPGREAGN